MSISRKEIKIWTRLGFVYFCVFELFAFLIADATVYVGGLDEKVTEAILWELFLQAGPVGKFVM